MIAEALARFRLEVEPVEKFQLVQVALESGRGQQPYYQQSSPIDQLRERFH